MNSVWLRELLWARECLNEVVGGTIVGLLVSVGLAVGGINTIVTHLVACLISTLVFAVLVGVRLASTPE